MIISQYICILYIYIYYCTTPELSLNINSGFAAAGQLAASKEVRLKSGRTQKSQFSLGNMNGFQGSRIFLKAYSITIYIHISRILDFSDDFSIWSQMISDLEFIWSSKTWCQKLQRPCHQRLHFLPRCTLAFGRLSRDGRVWRWIAGREIPQKWRFLAEKIIYKYSNIPSGKHTKSYWKWP